MSRALEQLERFAQILKPADVDEPILAPSVATAVHEWLVELNHANELKAVKVEPRRLALLYGPPGTGKTTLAHHVAARLGLPLVAVASERIVGKYLGETGGNLGQLFDLVSEVEDECVLLLDEFDALAQKRMAATSGAMQERNQALTVLLRRIEQFRGVGLAATNTKDALDAAMWRRFGLQISVDLPGADERFAILRKYALPFDLEDDAIDVLVEVTSGCRPDVVFGHVVASISPPPEMGQPPLWSGSRALGEIKRIAWPPVRQAA